ncbi:hypothetical protein RKD26_000743 [Streptomyces calvus]
MSPDLACRSRPSPLSPNRTVRIKAFRRTARAVTRFGLAAPDEHQAEALGLAARQLGPRNAAAYAPVPARDIEKSQDRCTSEQTTDFAGGQTAFSHDARRALYWAAGLGDEPQSRPATGSTSGASSPTGRPRAGSTSPTRP